MYLPGSRKRDIASAMAEGEIGFVEEKSPTLSSILSSQPLGESKKLQVRLKEVEQEKRKIEHDLRTTKIELERCKLDSAALRNRLDELPRAHNRQLQAHKHKCQSPSHVIGS